MKRLTTKSHNGNNVLSKLPAGAIYDMVRNPEKLSRDEMALRWGITKSYVGAIQNRKRQQFHEESRRAYREMRNHE